MLKFTSDSNKDYKTFIKLSIFFIIIFIQFLEKDFVNGFLDRWEKQIDALPNISKEEKNKMMLSLQTRKGWKMTGIDCYHLLGSLYATGHDRLKLII